MENVELLNQNLGVCSNREVNWLDLPDFIVSLVAEKLYHNMADYIRFGAVCHSWQLIYIENRHCLPRQLPLLMLSTELNSDDQTRSFYSLIDKRVYNYQVPVPHNSYCAGSTYGWLVIVSDNDQVRLLNPFLSLNNEINLPPITTLPPYIDITKAVLSASPLSNPNDYVLMIIFRESDKLAFYKPGDKVWTMIYLENSEMDVIEDVIYYSDQFYILDYRGHLFACDFNHQTHPTLYRVTPGEATSTAHKKYLVESSGDLLLVVRGRAVHFWTGAHRTEGFFFSKLDPLRHEWIQMHSLQGCALFLGKNSSLSFSASAFLGCEPNSVYFTDDFYDCNLDEPYEVKNHHDMGVFNLEDYTIKPLYPRQSKTILTAPIWIEPILQQCSN